MSCSESPLDWAARIIGTVLPLTLVVTALTALNLERAVFNVMSGLGAHGAYAWAAIDEGGTYAVFGLPSDPGRLTTAVLFDFLQPWVRMEAALSAGADDSRTGGPARSSGLLDRICQLILCAPDMMGRVADVELLSQFGLDQQLSRDLSVYGNPIRDAKGRAIGKRPLIDPRAGGRARPADGRP